MLINSAASYDTAAGRGQVRLTPPVSRQFPFREYLKADEYLDANREAAVKVILDVQAETMGDELFPRLFVRSENA